MNLAKKIIVFSLFLSCNVICKAQNVSIQKDSTDNTIFNRVELLPEFPGGMMGFAAYFSKSYKVPAAFSGSGTIYLSFIVEKDGSLTHIKIVRDLGYGTGEEAIRIMKVAPKWKPGLQDGKAVRVAYNLPIKLSSK